LNFVSGKGVAESYKERILKSINNKNVKPSQQDGGQASDVKRKTIRANLQLPFTFLLNYREKLGS
jgi:hypothetical protein